jgi:uncharacterized protein (DUF2235 family)
MPKTLVFCADGTWNGADVADAAPDGHGPAGTTGCAPQLTNVCKLFAWLQGDARPVGAGWGGVEMEKVLADAAGTPVQVAKYLHGVGNSAQLLDKIAGGYFGVGVTARIARGYTYLSRNYAPGDRIVIVGFSRGAYTARALAGLVAGQGLLRPELAAADDADRYDTATAAWYRWRSGRGTLLQHLGDGLIRLAESFGSFSRAKALDDAAFVPATIAAVAVWDTVGAMGIPVYEGGSALDVFRFCDTDLNPKIGLGVHAVSLDEQRKPFAPTLWTPSPRVTQALFPGGHCDVGGGYAEHGLSDAPLLWVAGRLQQADVGLKFGLHPPVAVEPDPLGPRHRAWAGSAMWAAAGLAPRAFPAGLMVDDSVRRRINGQPENLFGTQGPQAPYAPANLPK